MLLCDAAEASGGKLYVLGGGWSHLQMPDVPTSMSLAVLIRVPWDAANHKHKLRVQLVDDDAEQVLVDDNPVLSEGGFEVGRPPGLKAGTSLHATLTFRFNNLTLPAGGYVFELSMDGTVMARAPFRVGLN